MPVSMPALKKLSHQTAILSQRNIAILESNCQIFCVATQILSDAGIGFNINKQKAPQDFVKALGVLYFCSCFQAARSRMSISCNAVFSSSVKAEKATSST